MRLKREYIFLLILGIIVFSLLVSAAGEVERECLVEITIEEVGDLIVYDVGAGEPDCTGDAFEGCPEDWTMTNMVGHAAASITGYSCAIATVDENILPAYCEFTCNKTYITACGASCDPCGGAGPIGCIGDLQEKLVSCVEPILSDSVYRDCDPVEDTCEPEICNDGRDNDCDGSIDCDDFLDCSSDPYCADVFCVSINGSCDLEIGVDCCVSQGLSCVSEKCVCSEEDYEWDPVEDACVETVLPVCGDGVLNADEECDSGTGCNATCGCEAGYVPTFPLSVNCELAPPPTCQFTSALWWPSGVNEDDAVSLMVDGTNCDGQTVTFYIGEVDSGNDYAGRDQEDTDKLTIQSLEADFAGTQATGSWTAEWVLDENNFLGDDDPEYVFRAELKDNSSIYIDDSGELEVTQEEEEEPNPCIEDITICAHYSNQLECDADDCEVAEASVPPTVNCDDTDITCECLWNTISGICDASYTISEDGSAIGKCIYEQDTVDDCDDGFLSFSLIARWEWDEDNPEHNDPNNLAGDCVNVDKTVECPAQIPLPFFESYNIIIALAVIGLIYWIWSLKRK